MPALLLAAALCAASVAGAVEAAPGAKPAEAPPAGPPPVVAATPAPSGETAGGASGAAAAVPPPPPPVTTADAAPPPPPPSSVPPAATAAASVEPAPPTESSLWWPVAAPATALLLLGLAAYFLGRRRGVRAAPVELVGTLALGPRRQLVVARFGGEELLLGASEAGLQLLVRRPLAAAHGTEDAWLTDLAADGSSGPVDGAWPHGQRQTAPEDGVAVVAPVEVAAPGGPFEAMLDDSVEDHALRRKLAAGLRGGRS